MTQMFRKIERRKTNEKKKKFREMVVLLK